MFYVVFTNTTGYILFFIVCFSVYLGREPERGIRMQSEEGKRRKGGERRRYGKRKRQRKREVSRMREEQ